MGKKEIKIEKYVFNKNNTEYYVYVSKENEIEIYLGKKDYGIIIFEIGFLKGDNLDIETYIEICIDKWIEEFEEDYGEE